MKISERDKSLLIILGIVLILFGYYKFVFTKQMDKISKLNSQKKECELKLNQMKNNGNLATKTESEVKILNSKIEDKSNIFFNSLPQENLILLMDNMLKKSEISNNSINFSDPTSEKAGESNTSSTQKATTNENNMLYKLIDEYRNLTGDKQNSTLQSADQNKVSSTNAAKTPANAVSNTKTADNSVLKTEITMDYSGSYYNMMTLLGLFENYNKRIIVKSINIAANKDAGVAGSMVIDFYSIPKLTDTDDSESKWELNNTYGKDNPFLAFASKGTENKGAETNQAEKIAADFMMTSKPTSSDLPTVVLGRAKDSTMSTYVYADSEGIENVEIVFTEKNGKLYYKYKTSFGAHPSNFAQIGEEFTPSGDGINLVVYSTKRNSAEDKSGANIKVTNDTGKNVTVKVIGDDSQRPRISVLAVKGNVKEER